jgi:exo-1,4-beta-D-glucosaminidase
LSDNWFLQSSEKISLYGDKISRLNYSPKSWYPVTIPGTVVNGLVENKVYDDPYFGLNMQSIPGYKHGKTTHFSFHEMPKDSPFRKPWWYRNEFTLDSSFSDRSVWLQVKGINYSANIWMNGRQVATTDTVIGSFRRYDFDVTNHAMPGKKNVLAIEIFPPKPDDLSITFIDWGPTPPDDSMGIWQPVSICATGPVAIKHPFVRSKLDIKTFSAAELFISAELVNTRDKKITGTLEGSIGELFFSKKVSLKAFEERVILITPKECPGLTIKDPREWWPYQHGFPELYTAELKFVIDGGVSDSTTVNFGIRDIRSRINEHGARQFTVNGKDILIRGSAWTPDLMLRQDKERDDIDIAFLKNMNLNAFRMEGKLASDYFWDRCDREGVIVLAGWPCCTHWEKWDNWKPGDMDIARESLQSQIKRLRNHPSFAAWFYGSDFPPPEPVERMYLDVLEENYRELPSISNASVMPSALRGKTGVKMSGPYTYVPPAYWYNPDMPGHADSFNTETGPDVCIPVFESLKKMLPGDELYPGSKAWNHHAGLAFFTDTENVNDAVSKRYGEPKDIEDFAQTAQVLSYESWRAMYEAYARNYPEGTGVIAWMHNSSWPSMIWQLYDYFLHPTGGFYGARKACEPLHIQYSYDDASVWIINNTFARVNNLVAQAEVYTMDMKKPFERSKRVNIKEDARIHALTVPEMKGLSPVCFLILTLKSKSKIISRNCYWLPNTKDIFEKKSRTNFYWPLKQHADMSALRSLPKAACDTSYIIKKKKNENIITVTIKNISDTIAFFLWVKVIDKTGRESIAPVFWSDNCITLLPSGQETIIGRFTGNLGSKDIDVVVEGWNC